jgi:heterodisulfide reductase subunit C
MEAIDTFELDHDLKYRIARHEGGEGLLKCFACGTCTARCPEFDVNDEWNPRVVIRKALLGLKEEVFSSSFVGVCSSHYRCLEKCPQKVNVKGLMDAVRSERLNEERIEDLTGKRSGRSMDPTLKYRLTATEDGKQLYSCFACGTCTAGCPERDLDPLYSPRKVIRASIMGMKEQVFANRFIEICSTHHRCFTQCPQGVEIPRLMNAIRELAEEEGYKVRIDG